MKNWIGKSIIIIGIIHSVFGLVMFRSTLSEIINEGVFNTVNGQIMREFTFWFIVFGFLAIILGCLVDWCESQEIKIPNFLGWGLLVLTLLIVVIMPISGGWLFFIPSIGLILRVFSLSRLTG